MRRDQSERPDQHTLVEDIGGEHSDPEERNLSCGRDAPQPELVHDQGLRQAECQPPLQHRVVAEALPGSPDVDHAAAQVVQGRAQTSLQY